MWRVVNILSIAMLSAMMFSCDLDQMDEDEACEQIAETLYEQLKDCFYEVGAAMPGSENAFLDVACEDADSDHKVFVSDVDVCEDDLKDLDCNDLVYIEGNYIFVRDTDDFAPRSCEEIMYY